MTLLVPGWLFLLLLIPAVVVLHLFRRHRRSEVVPSLLIWKLLSKRTPRTLDLRVLRDLNLLLQILAVIAAAILLSQPVLPQAAATAGENVVLIVDVTAGMASEETGRPRIDAAVEAAREVALSVGASSRIAVIAAGAKPVLVQSYTESREAVQTALRTLRAQPVHGDTSAAVVMAMGLAGEAVHFFTDGAFDPSPELVAAVGGNSVVVHRVGEVAANVGITRLAARRTPDRWEVLVSVLNASDVGVGAELELSVDGEVIRTIPIALGPEEERYEVAAVEVAEEVELTAALRGLPPSSNSLVSDDVAVAIMDPTASAKIVLVSEGGYFLETILSVIPGVELERASSVPISGRYDAVIFDGVTPPPLFAGNYLLFGVRAPDLPTAFGDAREVRAPISGQPDHPLFRSVNLADVEVRRIRPIQSASSLEIIARAGDQPVAYTYERSGLRIVGFTFSLDDTDLPLRVAFPVLIKNAVSWLLPEGNVGAVRQVASGSPFSISVPLGDAVVIVYPSGRTERRVAESNPFVVEDTTETGVYQVRSQSVQRRFASALMSAEETDVRPVLEATTRVEAAGALSGGAGRPVWRFALILLMLCVAADWYVWVRRS